MRCKICGQEAAREFKLLLLKKHEVSYFRCPACGFLQTEEPYWLDEAYSSAISDLDLGPVNRAVTGARIVEGVILAGFDPNGRFVDWGGGYGVFTRLMRDRGYDFFWQDRYCQNLFAKQFVAEPRGGYDLMTAFEVFEHLVDPVAEVEEMLRWADGVFFTTLLRPAGLKDLSSWWYLSPDHGQHIAIYSVGALNALAERFNVFLTTDGASQHLLSRKPFPPRRFGRMVRDGRAAGLVRRIQRRRLRTPSRLAADFQTVTGYRL